MKTKKNVFILILTFILVLSLTQISKSNSGNNNGILSNGIYKIAIGKEPNKAMELPGGDKNNNAQLGIWDYRKWITSKILYRISNRWIL